MNMDRETFQDIFKDVFPILLKASPIIASFIGGPLTYIVMGLLAVLVNESPNHPQMIADKLSKDPDIYAKLEKLESTHSTWLTLAEELI